MQNELSDGERADLLSCRATSERGRLLTAQQVFRFHPMQQAPLRRRRRVEFDAGRHDQNFSTLDPASAPIAVISAAAKVYQVATNKGESSVQCEA